MSVAQTKRFSFVIPVTVLAEVVYILKTKFSALIAVLLTLTMQTQLQAGFKANEQINSLFCSICVAQKWSRL